MREPPEPPNQPTTSDSLPKADMTCDVVLSQGWDSEVFQAKPEIATSRIRQVTAHEPKYPDMQVISNNSDTNANIKLPILIML